MVTLDATESAQPADCAQSSQSIPLQKLVGYIFARRIGNGIRVVSIMVHGDHLHASAMKFMMSEFVRWVIEGQADYLKGIDYIHYGAAEHGGDGLLFWKTQFGFQPVVFETSRF